MRLAQEGMKIVIASTNKEKLEKAAEEIKSAGAHTVLPIVCDVSKRDSVANLHDEAEKALGPPDLLVCNSGVTTAGDFHDHREQDWAWVTDVVWNGVAYCIQLWYPEMIKRKHGHIVLIGSQAGMVPDWFTQHGPYTALKSAVMALGTGLRAEAVDHNVGITNVIVAGVTTEIAQSSKGKRPEGYGDALVHNVGRRQTRRIPASDCAEIIVKGVSENKAWVATHPDLKGVTSGYFDQILSAYDDHTIGLDKND